MFNRLNFFMIISFCCFVTACSDDDIEEHSDGSKTVNYEKLDWKYEVPAGWKVSSETERRHMAYKAETYYEDNAANNNDEKEIIMAVKKEDSSINAIYAFVRAYSKEEAEGPDMKELLRQQYKAYTNAPYSAKKSLTEERIGSHKFIKAHLDIYYNEQPYYTYTTYSTMIDTMNFGATITADNQSDRSLLTENFYKSVMTLK